MTDIPTAQEVGGAQTFQVKMTHNIIVMILLNDHPTNYHAYY